jgi:hypothetical protein
MTLPSGKNFASGPVQSPSWDSSIHSRLPYKVRKSLSQRHRGLHHWHVPEREGETKFKREDPRIRVGKGISLHREFLLLKIYKAYTIPSSSKL